MKIFTLTSAALVASSAHALTLPSLDKKDDEAAIAASVQMSFETTDDTSAITDAQLDAISAAFILSANEAHDSADYHMDSIKITKAGKDVVDDHATVTMFRSSAAKEEEGDNRVSISRTRYNLWNQGDITYTCGPTCSPDFLANMLQKADSKLVQRWEGCFCDILNQYESFTDVGKCIIYVTPPYVREV